MLAALPLPAPAEQDTAAGVAAFTDMGPADPAWRYVAFLREQGAVGGYPDGSFRPKSPVTRAEMAKLLAVLLKLPPARPEKGSFTDLKPDHWAYAYIEAGAKTGLWKGYPDGSFRPDSPLTRAEVAALLLRFAGVEPTGAAVAPADVPEGSWAYSFAAEALAAGLLPPTASGFSPQAPAGRLEVVRGLALAYVLAPARSAAPLSPRVSPLEGEVWVIDAAGQRGPAQATALGPGGTVETGPDGRAELTFEDGSAILLEPRTVLRLERAQGYRFIDVSGRERRGIDALELTLDRGTVFGALAATTWQESSPPAAAAGPRLAARTAPSPAATARLASAGSPPAAAGRLAAAAQKDEVPWYLRAYTRKARVRINMPWGVAGIRGTFWRIEVHETGFSASVLVGEAVVTAAGQTVSLRSGQYTEAAAGQAPIEPRAMPAEEKRAWVEKQAWVEEATRNIEANRPPVPPVEARELAGALLAAPAPGAPPEAAPAPPQGPAGQAPAVAPEDPVKALTELVGGLPAGPPEAAPAGGPEGGPAAGPPADTAPPTVASTDPANNATGVPVGKTITVTFSEDVQPGPAFDGISLKDAQGNAVAIAKNLSGRVLTIRPGANLAYSTVYTVTIPAGAVRDLPSNVLAVGYTFSFTTGPAPVAEYPEISNLEAEWLADQQALRVSWNEVAGADNYLVSWKPADQLSFGEPQTVIGRTYYEITGLEQDRAYTVRVQVYAGGAISAGKTLLAVTGRPASPAPQLAEGEVALLATSPGTRPLNLAVSGRWAVWQEVYHGDYYYYPYYPSEKIVVYDLKYGHAFAVASYSPPSYGLGPITVDGIRLAWAELRGGGWGAADIKVLDLQSGELTVVSAVYGVAQLSLVGDYLAWFDNAGEVHWQSLAQPEGGSARAPVPPGIEPTLLYPWLAWHAYAIGPDDSVASVVYAWNFADGAGGTPSAVWSALLSPSSGEEASEVVLTGSAGVYWAGWLVGAYQDTTYSEWYIYASRLGDGDGEPGIIPVGAHPPPAFAAGGGKLAWFRPRSEGGSWLAVYDPESSSLAEVAVADAPYNILYLATDGSAVLWWGPEESRGVALKAYRLPGGTAQGTG
jgi:hypothetical protein